MTKEADWFASLRSNDFVKQANYDYALETAMAYRTWQIQAEDNVAAGAPITLYLRIPTNTVEKNLILLHLKLLPWRSYSARTKTVPEVVGHSVSTTVESGWFGSTSPGGTDNHTHQVPKHYHDVTVPAHYHDIEQNIYFGTRAPDCYIKINGTDRTFDLGGPWTTDQDAIDIRPYIVNGWNAIELSCSGTQGRLHASIFVDIAVPRGGY